MSTLQIQFAPYTAGSSSAKIAFDLIDEQLQRVENVPKFIELGSVTSIAVEPGAYLVKVQLPNGETITNQTSVAINQLTNVTLFPKLTSPRESLSWAYYLKKTSRKVNVIDSSKSGEQESVGLNMPVRLQPKMTLFAIINPYHAFDPTEWVMELDDTFRSSATWHNIQIEWEPMHEPTKPNLLGQINISGLDYYPVQFCMCISTQDSIPKYVMVPPFSEVMALIIQEEIDGLSDKNSIKDPFDIVISSNNPSLESLLSYMTSGDFQSISKCNDQVLELAEKLLQGKKNDVMGAVIGGYVLLKSSSLSRLHDWTNNLADWFPEIPDTAVIYGWHLLKQAKPDPTQARELFIEAAERGIPYYTLGLRRLYDGLCLFRMKGSGEDEPEEPSLRRALDKLESYVAMADWEQPVTTLSGKFRR